MSFSFPNADRKVSEHITPDVRACLADWQKLPTRKEAQARAKNFFATSRSGATGLFSMTLCSDDSVALCFYGIRGGFKVIWNFGKA